MAMNKKWEPTESKRFGLNCRKKVKRLEHSKWDGSKRKHDPIDLLIAANRDRIPELVPIKMGRMAVSPFGFFRGSVPLMAADLASLPATAIQVQICGDAHVRNLGFFAAPDGRLIFDINDFDETICGPWEWDLKRLATSLILAGREAGNSDRLCKEAVQVFMSCYREAMLRFSNMPRLELARFRVHRQPSVNPIHSALHKAERTPPIQNLEKLTTARRDGSHIFKERKPFLVRVGRPLVSQIQRALNGYRNTLDPERQHLLSFYRPADTAFKIVGTGSVGLRDYVVLYFGNGEQDPLFLQVKEEPPSAYVPFLRKARSEINQGQRVVEGQRRMQAQSDLLLGWTRFGGRDYLVRQLSDHKASIDDNDLRGKGLLAYAHTSGEILAKGHARSGDPCALSAYIGSGAKLDKALVKFAVAYADQVTLDYEKFRDAIRSGRIKASRTPF
ncbi:MAG: DUF2252 domain-containing protein [Candidatus Korobacteraceae bacterium]